MLTEERTFAREDRLALAVCVAVAALLRIYRLVRVPVLHADAFHYAEIARQLATGHAADVSRFFFTFFCVPAALLQKLGMSPAASVLSLSFAAGLALIPVVHALALEAVPRRSVALLAALLVAVHPRVVQYATSGHTESLFTLLVTLSLWMLLRWSRLRGARDLCWSFVWAALAFSIRNEAIFYLPMFLVLIALIEWLRPSRALAAQARALGLSLVIYALLALAPALAMRPVLGYVSLFERASANMNLAVPFDEAHPEAWAKEVWGSGEIGAEPGAPLKNAVKVSPLKRFAQNYQILNANYFDRYIFWSALFFFFCLGAVAPFGARQPARWILLATLAGVHAAYLPFVFETRYLVQAFPSLAVLCAVGLDWTGRRVAAAYGPRISATLATAALGLGVLAPTAAICLVLTERHHQQRHGGFIEASRWLQANRPATAQLYASDGVFGFYSGLATHSIPSDPDLEKLATYLEHTGPLTLVLHGDEPRRFSPLEHRPGWSVIYRLDKPELIEALAYEPPH